MVECQISLVEGVWVELVNPPVCALSMVLGPEYSGVNLRGVAATS